MAKKTAKSVIPIDQDELLRRLAVWRGKPVKSKSERPKPGTGRSTTIRIMDIALLSRIHRENLRLFMARKINFGPVRQLRLYKVLLQVEGGLITKSQYGVYHFHDTPQRAPVRIMQLDFSTGRIKTAEKQKPAGRIPAWMEIFGRK